jgi:acyl-CoA hydrolase
VTTSAIGSQRLYDFIADNPGVEFHPIDHTNDPRIISREPHMTAINATLEVDSSASAHRSRWVRATGPRQADSPTTPAAQ